MNWYAEVLANPEDEDSDATEVITTDSPEDTDAVGDNDYSDRYRRALEEVLAKSSRVRKGHAVRIVIC